MAEESASRLSLCWSECFLPFLSLFLFAQPQLRLDTWKAKSDSRSTVKMENAAGSQRMMQRHSVNPLGSMLSTSSSLSSSRWRTLCGTVVVIAVPSDSPIPLSVGCML